MGQKTNQSAYDKYVAKSEARKAAGDALYDCSAYTPEWFAAKEALKKAMRAEDRAFKNYMLSGN